MKRIIENVVFDFGGTLVKMVPSREDICLQTLKELGFEYSTSQIMNAYSHVDFCYKDQPIILGSNNSTKKEYYSLFNYQLALYLGVEKIYERLNGELQTRMKHKKWKIFDEVELSIKNIRKNYNTYILSNWDNSLDSICEENGIKNLFDGIYSSEKIGIGKPDNRFYLEFVNNAMIDTSRSVYVGDNYYTDIVASRKCDFYPILVDRYEKFENCDCTVVKNLFDLVEMLND